MVSGRAAARRARSTRTRIPSRTGFADYPVAPGQAFYSPDFRQFLLPYETVRTAATPTPRCSNFLQTTYAAAADRGGWDRAALECDPHRWDSRH